MASGMPVIAFDNPAERAILEKGGGVLVSNAQEFVSSAKRLRSDQTGYFNEMSTVAMNRIRSEFNFERMSKTLIDIMSDVAENAHLDVVDHRLLLRARAETDELALYALNSFFDGENMVNDNIDSLSSLENVVFEKIRRSLKTSDNAANWCGLSKSSPFHYQQYFPDSVHLKSLCQKISAEYGLANPL
jgi:predicted GTPase